MKILLISQALNARYGGSAFSEASLAGTLSRLKHSVTVLCRKGAFDPQFIERFGNFPVEAYQPAQWLGAWLKKEHPLRLQIRQADVVHLNGHWRWENYFMARVCRSEGKPYVLQPRGMLLLGHRKIWIKRVFNWALGNYIVRNASRVIALSTFELDQWTRYRLPESKIVVLPNGVLGIEKSQPTPEENSVQFPESGLFVYLGRLEARKNLLFLLKAYREYRRRGGVAELWLVGPGERGYEEVLRRAIVKMGLSSHVRLQQPVFTSAKMQILQRALGLVYPAVEEPFGRVPFEALDAGTFPVVPKKSGSAEYLGPFLPECIYCDESVDSLSRTLMRLQKPDADLLNRKSEAQTWVRKELDWQRMGKRYEGLYQHTVTLSAPIHESGRDRAVLSSSASQ